MHIQQKSLDFYGVNPLNPPYHGDFKRNASVLSIYQTHVSLGSNLIENLYPQVHELIASTRYKWLKVIRKLIIEYAR